MYPSELPPGIEIGDRMVPFRDIHRTFAVTERGHRLASRIRFAPYKPASLSAAEWERLLGADVNALKHLWESWKAVRRFIALHLQSGADLSIRDMESLQLAALLQGRGEDVSNVEDAALRSRLAEAAADVLTDQASRLGALFRIIERMSDMSLALKAWQKASAVKGTHQEYFRYLAVHLFADQIPELLPLADRYPPVAYFLSKHEEALSRMAGLARDEFRYFPHEGISRKESHFDGLAERYLDAKAAWEARSIPDVTLAEEDQ